MNLYAKIVTESHEIKESVQFDPISFEKSIPHNMRYKTFDTLVDPDLPKRYLYWVTEAPFNRDELEQFQKAFKDTKFNAAYVTLRDLSGYDFWHDKGKGVLAEVGKNGYNANPYIDSMHEKWPDFNFDGEPYKSLAERKAEGIKETSSPVINKKPLSKEKYKALMNSLDDIITNIGSNKDQLLDLRDEIISKFNHVLGLKESEKLNEGAQSFIQNESIKRNQLIKESTDWKTLKDRLNACNSSYDIKELMLETMDSSDYSTYCDYHYEIDDADKSSLQWAKDELKKLADSKLNESKTPLNPMNKARDLITKFLKDNSIDATVLENTDEFSNAKGLKITINNNDYEFYPKQTIDGSSYSAGAVVNGEGGLYEGTDLQCLKGLFKRILDDLKATSNE